MTKKIPTKRKPPTKTKPAAKATRKPYVVVRSTNGLFCGQMTSRNGSEVTLVSSRRVGRFHPGECYNSLAQFASGFYWISPVVDGTRLILGVQEVLQTSKFAEQKLRAAFAGRQ